jgi:hypothetical protein
MTLNLGDFPRKENKAHGQLYHGEELGDSYTSLGVIIIIA